MITVVVAVIVFYGLAVTLMPMTLVNPAWIISGSVALAALTAVPFWQKWEAITRTRNIAVNVVCQLVAATGMFIAVILGVNYFARDISDSAVVRAEIVKVYTETRYRSKRVARNRYTRGEPYTVYFMDVRLPDGRVCKRSLSRESYNRYFGRVGRSRRERPDSIDLRLTPGALSMTVIEPAIKHN